MPETTQPAAAGQTTPCPFSSERELDYVDLVSEATIINQDQGNANVLLGDVLEGIKNHWTCARKCKFQKS